MGSGVASGYRRRRPRNSQLQTKRPHEMEKGENERERDDREIGSPAFPAACQSGFFLI